MTSASLPYLDRDLVDKISRLEFKTRQIVEGLISGRHKSPFRGHSVEFAQHREYAAGDDLRFLDWKVWAKSDRLYVKEFEEETNLRATFLLDASASMDYGEGEEHKYTYACTLTAALSYLLLRQSDSVGLSLFEDQLTQQTPLSNKHGHLRTLLRAMQTTKPAKKYDFESIMAQIAEQATQRGLLVLVSDLLATPESVYRGLKLLRQRRHDLVVFHVLHKDEVDFDFSGPTRFEGLEDPLTVSCDPRGLRDDYLAAMRGFLSELRRQCGRSGIDYRLVQTSEPVDAVLSSLLRERMRI